MFRRSLSIAARLLLAVGGSYTVTSGLTASMAVILRAIGVLPRDEAVLLASMLAFLIYLTILIWAFSEPRIRRLCIVLAMMGAVSWGGSGLVGLIQPGG